MAKHRRGRSSESTSVGPLPLALDDVYLLTAESDGQMAVGGLSLVVDHNGLVVSSPGGATAAALPWSEMTVLRTSGRTTILEGPDTVVLEASTATRTHRFAVPTDDPGALEQAIGSITGVPAPVPPRRGRRHRD
jgi:hypothetical protein